MDCRMSGPVPALLPLVYLVYICNQVILFNQRTAKQLSAEKASQVHPIIAFRAEPDLHAWADGQAAMGNMQETPAPQSDHAVRPNPNRKLFNASFIGAWSDRTALFP
jgi:hypothetical protein